MVGEILLHYRVTERLGAGGMGVVWKATDTHLGREVALKLLPPEDTGDALRVSRFLREARSASALNHPNIVTIFEANTAGDTPFIAMEYVRGVTLHQEIRSGRLGVLRSIEIALQICAALQHSHDAGIVHRDLKPGNIMLAPDGNVKVLDFGLAKRAVKAESSAADATVTAPLTVAGATVGTLAYMSPEQALGEEVDARSDLFSFGVVLYEMVSQSRPFDGHSKVSVVRRLVQSAPAPLRELVPGIPVALEAIVLRCLEKEPGDRYASAAEAAADLKQVLSATTQSASAPTATMFLPRARRRFRIRRLGFAAVALSLVIAGGAVGLHYYPVLFRTNRLAAGSGPTTYATDYEAYQAARGYLDHYYKSGNLERAVGALDAALRLNPNYALAYAGYSEAYLRRNITTPDPQWLRQAHDAARKAVELNSDLAAAHVALGMALADSPETLDRQGAAGEFHKALQLDPKNASGFLGLAKSAAASGDKQEAEKDFRRSIALAPGDWSFLTEFGIFLYRGSRYAEAAERWAQALQMAPDNVRVLRNLGVVYHLLDKDDDAAGAFQRALEIEPSSPVYTNLGTIRFFQGRYDDAVKAFEKALQLGGGGNYLYWGNLADADRWAPGHRPQSLEAYRHALELVREKIKAAPNDPDLQGSLAVYLAKSGDREAAVKQLATFESLAKMTANGRFQAAVAYELAGRRDQSLSSLDAALRMGYSPRDMRNEPELVSLRADSRFLPLLDRLAGAGTGKPVQH